MRLAPETFALALTAAAAVGLGHARDFARYPSREPIPASVFIPREGKRVACFITINSADEKGVFTQYLNPSEWDIVELTEPAANGSKYSWFDGACKKGIKCDIDVVSGHFAGRFFGSSGYTLGLEELENHSCAQDCRGILENPREVYLFGCNALATKEKDNRFGGPEGYFRHLVYDEGYAPEVARRVTDDRYSAFGQENRAKIQRSFPTVPYLYGFHSASPLGKDLKPIIENYMRKIGDFTKHFDAIAERGVDARTEINRPLQAAMKGQSFTQCAGLDPRDAEYAFHLQICALFDKRIPLAERLLSVEVMLNNEKVLSLLPSIQNFIRSNIREIKLAHNAIFERLEANRIGRNILLDTVKAVDAPMTKIAWMRFAHLMGWIAREDLVKVVLQLVDSAFSSDSFQTDLGDAICSLNIAGVDRLDYSSIIPKVRDFHFTTFSAANAMRCAGFPRYPEFRAKMNEVYKRRTNPNATDTALLAATFADSPALLDPTDADRELIARLRLQCERFPPVGFPNVDCARALAKLGATDEASVPVLIRIIESAPMLAQMKMAPAYASMAVGLDLLENAMLDIYLNPAMPYWDAFQKYFMLRPIRGDANRKRMLDYLMNRTDARRPDEMVFALREMRLSPTELKAAFEAIRAQRNVIITSKVLMGFLSLADTAGADAAFIEMLFERHSFVSVTNDDDLANFYATLKLPRVHDALKTSKTAQAAVCTILKSAEQNLGYDDYGDVIARQVPVKSCADLFAE